MITLIRHPPVPAEWKLRCYGATDVPLAASPAAFVAALVPVLQEQYGETLREAAFWHSGRERTRRPAAELAAALGRPVREDGRLAERNFGSWETQSWDAIHAATGEAMLGMVTHPDSWAPEGGETTFAHRDRAMGWLEQTIGTAEGRPQIAVAHGGTIAVLRGTLAGREVADWLPLIPDYGEAITLARAELGPLLASVRHGDER